MLLCLTKIGCVCFLRVLHTVLWDEAKTPSTDLMYYLHSTTDIPINKLSAILNNSLLSRTRETYSCVFRQPDTAASFDVMNRMLNRAPQCRTSMGLIDAVKVHGTHAVTCKHK